jgi:hypothetical protein
VNYITYLKEKLNIADTSAIIDHAIEYIGDKYPSQSHTLKGYEIIDTWIEKIIFKWNVEINILNLSKSSFHGNLESRSNGFTINLNKSLYTTQRRFALAHELAHIISFNTNSEWPEYAVLHSWSEEHYCNRIARAMLLPKTLIDYSKFDLNSFSTLQLKYIKELWPEFKVSPWQIVSKLYEDGYGEESSMAIILWEFFAKESCLKIVDYHKPKDVFIPKNDRIFLDNLLKERVTNLSPKIAFNSNDIYFGDDIIEIGSLYKKKLFCSTFPIKTKTTTYIIQLIKL